MINRQQAGNWAAWSPVAAVAWASLAIGGAATLGQIRGCDFAPIGPVAPDRPDWIPPHPPTPPTPTPNPMGETLRRSTYDWRPFPAGAMLEGYEALCTDLDGVTVMTKIRRRQQ